MKLDTKISVIPFSELEEEAYEYCKQENHISEDTPLKRREKFEKQSAKVWEKIRQGEVQMELLFVEDGAGAELFPGEWVEKHFKEKKTPVHICLYSLRILQELPREEKISMQFLQDTWCTSVILAAKDKVEQYLMEDRWGAEKIESFAPGIEDLPLEYVCVWKKYFEEAGIHIEVDADGHMIPENSLAAAYIEIR